MTEYWVSQGNKWCEFCKIYISNNVSSIRNHELGRRHKDSVTRRLDSMRRETAAKEREEIRVAQTVQMIEMRVQRSSGRDMAALTHSGLPSPPPDDVYLTSEDWKYEGSTGYYINKGTGLHYDPRSHFYYSDRIGKWVAREYIPKSVFLSPPQDKQATDRNHAPGPRPARLVSGSLNPMRAIKGAPCSLTAAKRKRADEKPKPVTPEETSALKAREAARKRVEEREKNMLGLYK